MLDALRNSNEPDHLVAEAKKYLKGLKGNLVQMKKQRALKKQAAREAEAEMRFARARAPVSWVG